MRKKAVRRLLVFGGAFDPPHAGHMHLLQSAIDAVQPDLALVMPTGVSPHKAAAATPGMLRYAMCSCFLTVDGRVRRSAFELVRRGRSYTVDTVRHLARRYPAAEIFLCIGGDMLRTFRTWRAWETLLSMVTLCVQYRAAGEQAALAGERAALIAAGGRLVETAAPVLEMSSSTVRAALARGLSVDGLVPAAAQRVIRRFGLYKGMVSRRRMIRAVRANMSDKRWQHTLAVRRCAVAMARRFGESRRAAALAALLHDFLKESSKVQLLQIFADNAIMDNSLAALAQGAAAGCTAPEMDDVGPDVQALTAPLRARAPAAWHGVCAAAEVRRRFGVWDDAVLSAIACHTTGKPGMSKLDKIIYLADMICDGRHWDGVDTLRALCGKDLDAAMHWALRESLVFVRQKGTVEDPCTLAALQEYETRKGDRL